MSRAHDPTGLTSGGSITSGLTTRAPRPRPRAFPYSVGIAMKTIATAWPVAGYGALVIWAAGDFGRTGSLWLFGWPFVVQLLVVTATHLWVMGLGARTGLTSVVPGIDALNHAVVCEEAGLPIEPSILVPALRAVVRLPVVNAAIGGGLALLVTVCATSLEWAVAGSSSPNVWVIARSGIFVSIFYVAASFSLGELLVRPCCYRFRRMAAAAGLSPYDGFVVPRAWRIALTIAPVMVALLVACEIATTAQHGTSTGYVVLLVLTGVIALALGALQHRNVNAAVQEFGVACRELASGSGGLLVTGSIDATLWRVVREFNSAASSVGADRRASSAALQRLVRRLEELYRVALLLTDRPAEIAEHVVRTLPELLEVPIATVETLEGDDIVVLAMSVNGSVEHGSRFPLRQTPCADVRRDRRHCIFEEVAEKFPEDSFLREHGIRTYAGVPIIDSRLEVVGIVAVLDRRARTFRDEDVQLLRTFARRIGSAFDEERFSREREALNAQLADQLAALRIAQARLIEDDRVKTEFVGMMSHELRTPINILLGYTQMLLDTAQGSDAMTDGDRAEILTRMLAGGHTLSELIEDTLSVLRLEAGAANLHLESVDLQTLFEDLQATARALPPRSNVEERWLIDAGVPALVTDRRKLRQVITNLVGNARKFTARGRIEVHAQRAGSNGVRIRVMDTGCGIDADDLPLIFDLYRQASNGGAQEGCGLGLYIVRRYAEMLQGTVSCVSRPGQGSTFTIELPRSVGAASMREPVATGEYRTAQIAS